MTDCFWCRMLEWQFSYFPPVTCFLILLLHSTLFQYQTIMHNTLVRLIDYSIKEQTNYSSLFNYYFRYWKRQSCKEVMCNFRLVVCVLIYHDDQPWKHFFLYLSYRHSWLKQTALILFLSELAFGRSHVFVSLCFDFDKKVAVFFILKYLPLQYLHTYIFPTERFTLFPNSL